ncbi:hypothetical protein KKC17_02295 [Patescibacteria group bacterium]|nr:hypothetical protein [Patescibacteria group bacterium]
MFKHSLWETLKKIATIFAIIFVLLGGFTLTARPAQAIPVSDILGAPIKLANFIWEKVQSAVSWTLEHGAAIGFRNAARTFTQKIAYDAAVMLASGGTGQTPLFTWKNLGQSVKDAGDAAAGDFLDGITSGDAWGNFNVCQPSGPGAPSVKLIIGLTAFQEQKPPVPKCTLSQLRNNWDKALNDPIERKNFLKNFKVSLDPKQHDLGVSLNIQQNLIKDVNTKKELAKLEQTSNQGYKDIVQSITGFIKTPARSVANTKDWSFQQALAEPLVFTGDIMADALGTFTNTLAARLLKRLMEGEIPNPASIGKGSIFAAEFGSGTDYATKINTLIAMPQIVGGEAIDVISEFSNCPQNQDYAALNNCTIDSKFERALRQAQEGKAVTVQEAVDAGLLNGNWVFKLDRPRNIRTPDAWYLSDIKKLRLARILPLGWELATQKVGSRGVTLNEVLSNFGQPYLNNDVNQTNPYYHLIDPNWIIKAPLAQCRLQGSGQILEQQGSNRQDICVDTQNCVVENPDGTCASWGYCTKEKNVWRLGGDSCEFPRDSGQAPFASCQTFSSSGGGSASYLTNSLASFNDGNCTGATGCKWYSTAFNSLDTSLGRYDLNSRLYAKNIDRYSCSSNDEGCTALLRLSNISTSLTAAGANPVEKVVNQVTSQSGQDYSTYATTAEVYLKQAPDYLKCYDNDLKNDSPECAKYIGWCAAGEVGCELYTPLDGTPAVPGQPHPDYTCPGECVGYQAYEQQPTKLNPSDKSVKYFITKTAQTCPAEAVGCSEFTNVGLGEQKEYFTELRQCVQPGEGDRTYYTWVGSDLTGYQLKAWQLKFEATGPVTTDNSGDCRLSGSWPTSNPDCKQLYASDGQVYYRLASKTVTASSSCTRYRKTEGNQVDCLATGGNWENNACYYRAIPQEGKKCSVQYNGCREYKGPNANSVKLVFPLSTFGDKDSTARVTYDAAPSSGWYSGTPSNESTSAFGHSYDSGTDGAIYKDVVGSAVLGQQYLVSVWAKKSSLGLAETSSQVPAVTLTTNLPAKVSWSNQLVNSLIKANKLAWQNLFGNWTFISEAIAQTATVALQASPSVFDNTGFANAFSTNLSWSASTTATDAITVNIPGVLSTSFKADSRCFYAGSKTDNPCTNNDACRDLTPACVPQDFKCTSGLNINKTCSPTDNNFCQQPTATCNSVDYKCVGGPYNDSACNIANGNSDCRNTTATCVDNKCSNNNAIACVGTDTTPCRSTTALCQATKKICSNENTKICSLDSDCRYPSAQCLSTVSKCDSGFKSGQVCGVKDDCIDKTPVCQSAPTGPKSGTINVNLPTQSFSDGYTLPISKTYDLTVVYNGTTTVNRQAPVQVNNPPGKFNITVPVDGSSNQVLSPTIQWTSSLRANKYDISITGGTAYSTTTTATSFTVPGNILSANTNYTVRVIAKNDSSKTEEKTITFTTGSLAAKPFDIYSPADDPTTPEDEKKSMPLPFTVAWGASSDAVNYLVIIEQPYGTPVIWRALAKTELTMPVNVGAIKLGQATKIRVVAYNSAGTPTERAIEFITQVPPQAFATVDPHGSQDNYAKVNTNNPVLTWQRANYADKYDVQLMHYDDKSTLADGWQEIGRKNDVDRFTLSLPVAGLAASDFIGLEPGRTYAWRVTAKNLAGQTISDGGKFSYFLVDTFVAQAGSGTGFFSLPKDVGSNKNIQLPIAPTGLTASLAICSGDCPSGQYKATLNWQDSSDNETGFTVYRGDNGRAVKLIQVLPNAGAVSFPDLGVDPVDGQNKGLSLDGRFVYQVRAYNSGGESKGLTTVVSTPRTPTTPPGTGSGDPVVTNQGTVYLKMTLNGQPVAGGGAYSLNNNTAGSNIPITGLVIRSNQPSGDFNFIWRSGNPVGTSGATVYSVEANPGGSQTCIGNDCGPVNGILTDNGSLTYTVNYVSAAESSLNPQATINFNLPASELTNDWQLYTIGPVTLPTSANISQGVRVQLAAAGVRFVADNIAVQEVGDRFFLKKDSWTTPTSCQPNGDQLKYLGCRSYKDRQNRAYSFTGFSKLCRQEAVGCEALVDTKNSLSPQLQTVTVGGQTVTTAKDQVVYRIYDRTKQCSAQMQSCQRLGEPSFTAAGFLQGWSDKFMRLDPDNFAAGPTSPLCSKEQDRCQEYKAGNSTYYFKDPGSRTCEYKQLRAGQSYDWYKTGTTEPCNLLINGSFENFAGISGLKGSGQINDNTQDYFVGWERNGAGQEDGKGQLYAQGSLNGQYWGGSLLKVKATSDQQYSGVWSSHVTVEPKNQERLFLVSAQIYLPKEEVLQGSWSLSRHAYPKVGTGCGGGTCHHYEMVAGNPTIVVTDPKGVWLNRTYIIKTKPNIDTLSVGLITNEGSLRQTSTVYVDDVRLLELPNSLTNDQAKEFLAVPYAYTCPAEASSCKAFQDNTLTNRTYYYLDNGKLDRSTCGGKVGEKDGCLLVTDLSLGGDLAWSAPLTYEQSRSQDNAQVAPLAPRGVCSSEPSRSCQKTADCLGDNVYCSFTQGQQPSANTILKVQRDRVCAEWLSCQTSTTITDSAGKPRELCYSLGRCNQASSGNAAGGCGNWLEPQSEQHPLDEADYIGRNTTWAGQDYTGYSIPGLCSLDAINSSSACAVSLASTKACRLYPEPDAPFPANVATWNSESKEAKLMSRAPGYKDANVCQPSTDPDENCECAYQRAVYKNGETRFYNYRSQPTDPINPVGEVCAGSLSGSEPCLEAKQEQSALKQITFAQGLKGYCLEKDSARKINNGADDACLTWLPIDVVQGEVSIYDDRPKAGFVSPGNQAMYYCAAARGLAQTTSKQSQLYYLDNPQPITFLPENARSVQGVPLAPSDVVTGPTTDCLYSPNASTAWDGKDKVCPNVGGQSFSLFGLTGIFSPAKTGQPFAPLIISGKVDYEMSFALSLGGLEKQLGGLDAIESIEIEGHFRKYGQTDSNNKRSRLIVSRYKLSDQVNRYSCDSDGKGLCSMTAVFNPNDPDKYLTLRINDKDPGGAADFYIVLKYTLREWCDVVAQVVSSNPNDVINNKAQTNRVNELSNYVVPQVGYTYATAGSKANHYLNAPFGAFVPSSTTFEYTGHLGPELEPTRVIPVAQYQPLISNEIQPYAPGVYGCSGAGGGSCSGWMCLAGVPDKDNPNITINKDKSLCDPAATGENRFCGYYDPTVHCDSSTGQPCPTQKTPFMCTGTSPALSLPTSSIGGVNLIKNLFVKFYNTFNWDTATAKYKALPKDPITFTIPIFNIPITLPGGSFDLSNQTIPGVVEPQAPVIAGVSFDAKGKTMGQDAGAKVTVSYSGTSHTSEDIMGQSPLPITLSFYGYNPNGNQMPIRFVGVDWGINGALGKSRNIEVEASLRNHKPICQSPKVCIGTPTPCTTDKQCASGKTCLNNPAFNFGDSPEACVADQDNQVGYFFYTTTYTCSGKNNLNWDSTLQACVYKPGVALRDNWGWWAKDNGQYEDKLPSINTGFNWSARADYYPKRIIVKPKN